MQEENPPTDSLQTCTVTAALSWVSSSKPTLQILHFASLPNGMDQCFERNAPPLCLCVCMCVLVCVSVCVHVHACSHKSSVALGLEAVSRHNGNAPHHRENIQSKDFPFMLQGNLRFLAATLEQ